MDGPNPELLRRYGTQAFYQDRLEKCADVPLLLQLLGPLGTMALLSSENERQAKQEQEAAIMNALLAQAQEARMRPVHEGLGGAPAVSALGRAAQGHGERQSVARLQASMDKAAMIKAAIGVPFATLLPKLKTVAGAVAKPAVQGAGALGRGAAAVGTGAAGVGRGVAKAFTPGWKTKAGIGLGMYGAYKGLQATKDYMMQPTYASSVWGGYGTLK